MKEKSRLVCAATPSKMFSSQSKRGLRAGRSGHNAQLGNIANDDFPELAGEMEEQRTGTTQGTMFYFFLFEGKTRRLVKKSFV